MYQSQYKNLNLLLRGLEFIFIMSIVLIPCFVAKMSVEGTYYNIDYAFIDVFGLLLKNFNGKDIISLVSLDIFSIYLCLSILGGLISCVLSIASLLLSYNKEVNVAKKVKKKVKTNNVFYIGTLLVIVFGSRHLGIPYMEYVISSIYYSINLWIIVPAIILVVYLVVYIKYSLLKKEVLDNEG